MNDATRYDTDPATVTEARLFSAARERRAADLRAQAAQLIAKAAELEASAAHCRYLGAKMEAGE
ncbi:MAG: hypothetical protein JNL82_29935 [Myxococcales bacterium]|nr:hypothetical protein [Myxococcales bacterium]